MYKEANDEHIGKSVNQEKGQHGGMMRERNGGSYSFRTEEISKGVIYVG